MKILAVGEFRADATHAHVINTVKTAQGFSKNNHQVFLRCRSPRNRDFTQTDFQNRFSLPAQVEVRFGRVGPEMYRPVAEKIFRRSPLTPPRSLLAFASVLDSVEDLEELQPAMAYCRSHSAAALSSAYGVPTTLEMHGPPGAAPGGFRQVLRAFQDFDQMRSLITISPVLKSLYSSQGIPPERIFIVPGGVDLDGFDLQPKLSGDKTDFTAIYTGSLEPYKGIPTILAAAALLPQTRFRLVGGQPSDWAKVCKTIEQQGLQNVTLDCWVEHSQIPTVLQAADALLIVPSATSPSANWTSPVKLGEYLASGVPVIASNIPALREWVSDQVIWCEPDDPRSLANSIQALQDGTLPTELMREKALRLANLLGYKQRAQKIIKDTL